MLEIFDNEEVLMQRVVVHVSQERVRVSEGEVLILQQVEGREINVVVCVENEEVHPRV